LRFGDVGEQAQHCEADQKAIRLIASPETECGSERLALGRRQPVEAIEERRAQLVQSGERQFHLGLDAGSSHHATARGVREAVVEKGRLADPGLAAEYEHAARPGSRIVDKSREHFTLGASVLQPWSGLER
jgi:hypothetical protein